MGKIKFILLAFAAIALAGCMSAKVTTSASAAVDFSQFHTVKLSVTESAKTAYAKEGLPMFEGLLKGRLQSLGYTIAEADPELVVNVTVSQFDPGNRTMRTLVGFGAGRAVLKYTARFQTPRRTGRRQGLPWNGDGGQPDVQVRRGHAHGPDFLFRQPDRAEFIQNKGRAKK